MSWSYLGQFNGNGWTMSTPPAAAVDGNGNLWVMWGGTDNVLTYFTCPLGQIPTSGTVATSEFSDQATGGPPCLIPTQGGMVAVWRDAASDAQIYLQQVNAGERTIGGIAIPDAATSDGPLATYAPGAAGADTLLVVWRGVNDENFYYSNVSGLAANSPGVGDSTEFGAAAGSLPFASSASPAVALMSGGTVCACWKGQDSDGRLYFSTAAGIVNPGLAPVAAPIDFGIPGGGEMLMTINRPSLARLAGPTSESMVMVFTNLVHQLSYLVGTMSGGTLLWGGPIENGGAPGILPVDALLATAGPGGTPVALTSPAAVWAAAPSGGSPLYLVVADQPNGTITGPLYLLSYSGE